MLKYIFRLLTYITVFAVVWSISSVVVYRFVPITVTPLKVLRMFENFGDAGLSFNSNWVSIENINPTMIDAVVASEDNNFLEHHGIDVDQVKEAIEHNKRGKRIRGASTISQQTAKNVFCLPSRTWFRKGVETYYTFLIELIWGKKRIMEVYLNIIETGVNVYGVGGASERYYGKAPSKLNSYESAMIATVLPNPRVRNIAKPSSYMVRRASKIRRLMYCVPKVRFDQEKEKSKKKRKK